jgi:hypothetical protein
MSLNKDYYTAAELLAQRELERRAARSATRPTESAGRRPDRKAVRPQRLQSLYDQKSSRLLVGAWSSNFIHS